MYHNLMMKNQTIFTKLVFEKLTEENLSIGQPKILEYLSSHDGAIQKEIAEACNIEPATLTSLLSRMEKMGLIKRKNMNEDKRYTCVNLTDLGECEGKNVIKALEETEKMALEGFTNNEKEDFINYLEKVNKNLLKVKEENK